MEVKLINMFNEQRNIKEYSEIIQIDNKKYLYVASPFLENQKSCIKCHGKREDAPVQLREIYKGQGGFNEKEKDIRAIISIRAPLDRESLNVYIIFFTLLTGVIAVISLFIFNARLKRVVCNRTKSLEQEIVNRKQTEEALRESETFMRSLVETLPDLVWLKDPAGVYMACNSQFERLFGAKQSEILGKTDYDFIDGELADFFRDKDKAAIIAGKPVVNEEEVTYADDGHREILETVKTPMFDSRGKLIGVLGVGRNITDRKKIETAIRKSEEQWDRTFNSFTDIVTLQDTNLQIVKANQAACATAGLNHGEIIGYHCHELFLDLKEPCHDCPLLQTKDNFESYTREMFHKKSGKTFLVSATPVFDEGGKLSYIAHVAKDISAQKKLESQLFQSQKMESIGNLAGGIAHDFNNILTVININAEVALMELEEGSELWINVDEVHKAGKRAANLTRQLLAFSRKQMITPRSVNINKLIVDLGKMLARLVSEDINLETILDKQVGRIYADPGQLEQVIINLVVNARDAVKKQPDSAKKIIKVSTSLVFMDNNYVAIHEGSSQGWHLQLQVEDSGCGMTEEVRNHIFEPFYTTKATGEGTGLGLATVYGIVKQNKGSIYVYSEPEQGTIFKVYWPIMEEEVFADEDHGLQLATGGSEVILLAEDNKPIREIASRQLRKAGYTVVDTADGREALEKAAEYQGAIDLLFTDVVMPVMGGKELSEKIKGLYPDILVLFASGYTDRDIHQDILALGKNCFINKPYSNQDILIRIRQLLDDRES